MARYVAIFALVVAVSGLNQALEAQNALKELSLMELEQKMFKDVPTETLKQTSKTLDKYLASFETKNLKDKAVFEEYLAVRDGAKRATSMLESVKRADEEEEDKENEEAVASALKADAEVEEAEKVESSDILEQDDVLEDTKEEKVDETKEHKEGKKALKLKLNGKKKHLKPAFESKEDKEEFRKDVQRKFSSPYRAASKKQEPQKVAVTDEGNGNYGHFKDKIYGTFKEPAASSFIQESFGPTGVLKSKDLQDPAPKPHRNYWGHSPAPAHLIKVEKVQDIYDVTKHPGYVHSAEYQKLQDEIKQRDEDIANDDKREQYAIRMAEHRHQICRDKHGDKPLCHHDVDARLKSGHYNRLLAQQLNFRHMHGFTPHSVPLEKAELPEPTQAPAPAVERDDNLPSYIN